MKKIILLICGLFFIVNCKAVQLKFNSKDIDSVCIDDVKYYLYGDNFALAVNKKAEIVICEPDDGKGNFWPDKMKVK